MGLGRARLKPVRRGRVISDEENAHVGLLLLLPASYSEEAGIKAQCSNSFA